MPEKVLYFNTISILNYNLFNLLFPNVIVSAHWLKSANLKFLFCFFLNPTNTFYEATLCKRQTYVHLPYWRHQEVADQGRGGGRGGRAGREQKKQRIITIYNQVSDTSYKILLKTNQNHDFNAVTHPHRCISTIYNVCRLNLIYNIFPNNFNGYPDCLDIFFV